MVGPVAAALPVTAVCDTVGDAEKVSRNVDRLRRVTILNDDQRRLLTFVQAANHGGYSPTPAEAIEWVERPDLKPGKVTERRVEMPPLFNSETARAIAETMSRDVTKVAEAISRQMAEALTPTVRQLANLNTLWSGERVIEEREPDETLIQQAQRFRWIETSPTGTGLLLMRLGRALLRADTDQAVAAEITMLGGDDPLAWGSLVETIADAGACIIVDPYLKSDQFLDIAKFTGTTRVLLNRPDSQNGKNGLISWQLYQAIPGVGVEVRVTDREHLHDRFIVGETTVYTLGCSLNGVGRKPTTLVPLTGEVANQVRATVEGWWKAAEPIGDPPVAEAEPEQDAGEAEPEQAGDEPQAP